MGALFCALASVAPWIVISLTSSWLTSVEVTPTPRPFRFPPDGALSFVLSDEESEMFSSLLRPAVLAAAPVLAFVLTRRRVELRLSLG